MTSPKVIGLLHPGEMGSAVGRCLTNRGYAVLWAAAGRSADTRARADAVGLTEVSALAELTGRCDVIMSICPPHAALDVAGAVATFGGLYVDANAVSPTTARAVGRIVEKAGARYVDGGIIGPPPRSPGSTRLYLSGADAEAVAALFGGTALDAQVIASDPWGASAVKMAYAAWTKGSAALLLMARALADAQGVGDVLLAEWGASQPDLEQRVRLAAQSAAAKGWRWVAEMEEIAGTMAAADLPDGFHRAAAEVYRRIPRQRSELTEPADFSAVTAALTRYREHRERTEQKA